LVIAAFVLFFFAVFSLLSIKMGAWQGGTKLAGARLAMVCTLLSIPSAVLAGIDPSDDVFRGPLVSSELVDASPSWEVSMAKKKYEIEAGIYLRISSCRM
jgi:hypothetical protein